MANSLISPGVQVTVIDESNYAPTAVGTVPFILLATAQDKLTPAGTIAPATTAANIGQIYTVGSQRELVSLFGMPTFPTDASGNRIFGSELAEYGLHAAYNVLDIISSAYIVRADIDLKQLQQSSVRPYAPAAGGTLWLDSATTSWGLFAWDSVAQAFSKITPNFIYNSAQTDQYNVPLNSFGNIGDYVIVGTTTYNPCYYKNYLNTWVLVGSTNWASTSAPAVTANFQNVSNLTPGSVIKINNTTITLGSTTDSALVAQINAQNGGAGITGLHAAMVGNKFTLFVTPASMSNGTNVDGAVSIQNVSGDALVKLGITAGTQYGPLVQFSPHTSVPQWKSIYAQPRPTGSIWVKTTNYNFGANLSSYRRNSITNTWDLIPNLLYSGNSSALYGLDPTNGGLNIARGTLYTQYNPEKDGTVQFRTYIRGTTGPTIVTGAASNPTLTAGQQFTIFATQVGSSTLTSVYTVTVPSSPNNTVAGVAAAISASNIVQGSKVLVTASVNSSGNLVITHNFGGAIYINDINGGNTLATLGFTTDLTYVTASDSTPGQLVFSNWILPTMPAIIEQPNEPTAIPTSGTLWVSSGTDVDIMINSGHAWKGYQNVSQDARGYNLMMCDPNGPIITASMPTANSMGNALAYGDIWIDTTDFDNYPSIYRWESVSGTDTWVQLDLTDATTENGIVFADARWDKDGTSDIFLDPIPLITDLLKSDHVDLDAPDPTLYPIGCLLFNTRRSTNNVKKYIKNYFNANAFPLVGLPQVTDTWQSYSGKNWNNVPFFGRKAVRNVVVARLEEAVDTNTVLREEGKDFNLLVCPGYPELLKNLKVLNDDRKNTGFIIGEVPMGLSTDSTTIQNYLTDSTGSGITGEDGMTTADPYTAVFYPGVAIMNALDGGSNIAVPTTSVMLRTFIRSDQIGEIWFAPAGNTRGVIDNVISVGYIDRANFNAFVPTGCPQDLRDLLYTYQVNPITFFPGVGRINYGNHTRQATATALDRINVARLVAYLRKQFEVLVRPLIFEPNDKLTRDTAKSLLDKLLIDVTSRRGVYDHLVVCDRSNNTNDTIDRNELHIDVAIEPVKAVEFIYIPVRLKGTGQIAAGNLAPSLPLG